MSEDDLRAELAQILWADDTGGGVPLSAAQPGTQRTYARIAGSLLPVVLRYGREIAADELRAAATAVMHQHGTASLAAKCIRTRSIALDGGSDELARCYYVS